jgi:hypothetical protein
VRVTRAGDAAKARLIHTPVHTRSAERVIRLRQDGSFPCALPEATFVRRYRHSFAS